jgi:nicotinate-nucleotide--dimethylbenzimidazole phosphoribosyltransferase
LDETNVVAETRDDAPALVSEWSAEETTGESAMDSSDSTGVNTDDAPWETFDQAVAAAEPPSVDAFSAHWDAPSQQSMPETVAAMDQSTEWNWQAPEETVEAAAETISEPAEAVAPPAALAPEWSWESASEPTQPMTEPTEAVAEPAESFAEPAESFAEPAQDQTPEWNWHAADEPMVEPTEAVAEPASQIADEPVEAFEETVTPWEPTIEAVAEPVDVVGEPVAESTADWDTHTEAAADLTNEWNWEAPQETVEAVAEPAAEPVEAAVAHAPEWNGDASPEPVAEWVEAVAEPSQPTAETEASVLAEAPTADRSYALDALSVAIAAVPSDTDPAIEHVAEATGDEEMDTFVEGRPSWDMPEPFEFDDGDTVDDRPMDMLASYDEMMPIVTAAVAAAKTEPVAATVEASAEDAAAQDPDDAMAPVLNDVDVDQPQVPNWTLWQPPSDVVDGRPVHQPAFVGKVVGPTPPDDLFEESETDDTPKEAAQPQTTAQVIGATIATEVGDAVVHQVPALYSTAPYGIQQPLVVRIELTIVDESNKLRAAEMARPVGPWSDVPVDPEEFDDEADDQDQSQASTTTPPNQPSRSHWDNAMANAPTARQGDPDAAAWAIPALDNNQPTNGRASNATWAPLEHDDPLADLPAAPSQANGQAQPAWFDSAAPVRTVKPGASQASARSASGVQPAANGDQSDLWFLASEPDGYVADQPASDKQQSSRLVMTGVTVVMAAVVVLLVLVFIQLMTSLLK